MNRAKTEFTALIVLVVFCSLGTYHSVNTAIARAAEFDSPVLRTATEAQVRAGLGVLAYVVGMLAMAAARARSLYRGRCNLEASLILPAVAGATGLGLILQMGYGDPLRWVTWPGPGFAWGIGMGGIAAAVVLASPKDPIQIIRQYRVPLAALVILGCVGLRLFGSGPEGTNTFINVELGGMSFQPLEAIKLAFVCLIGLSLGENAIKLRFQRERAWLLRFPRPRLLALATFFLVVLFAGLVLLANDLGPTLVLSLVFLALFYMVTKSAEWVTVAVTLIAVGVLVISRDPLITGSQTLVTRFEMWLNPWFNGLPNGSQLAESLWAIAAGGFWGQGLGEAYVGGLSAGHTDLMVAHLAEEMGVWGGALYLGLIAVIVGQGLWTAAGNREPERVLVGAGCALLLLCQWAVNFGGTTGLLPLTGLASPFLSWGKSSMVVFLVATGILLRLAEDGRPRAFTTELTELRSGVIRAASAAALLVAFAAGHLFYLGVIRGPWNSAHGAIVTLRDGTVRERFDPRLTALIRQIGRGEILDRNGQVLAGTRSDGKREYPLGAALGTLLGPPYADVTLRREWSLERIHETTLRGYPERDVRPAVWKARAANGRERFLFAVSDGQERAEDRERAHLLARGDSIRLVPLPAPDYSALARLLHRRGAARDRLVQREIGDAAKRSVRLTLDSRLQRAAADVLVRHAVKGEAAAAVVLDVDTGQVLARAQVPDIDIGGEGWSERLHTRDQEVTGIYGPLADKTGVLGFYQAGSVAKVFTSLVAARNGLQADGERCNIQTRKAFYCTKRDHQGPYFTSAGWPLPIHDHHRQQAHGRIELVEALAHSCNVYFAQLGLELGPEQLRSPSQEGVEIGWNAMFEPGEAGSRQLASTAFGQGASAMNVSQAARLVAAVGSGGVYRRCPSSLLLDAPCERTRLVDNPGGISAILAGMRRAVTTGTAAHLTKVAGVRVYGKTGTADSIAIDDEKPYGYEPGTTGLKPHSWFLALAEAADQEPCHAYGTGRLAVAVVIPRGGGGSQAGAAAMDIIAAARDIGYLGAALTRSF